MKFRYQAKTQEGELQVGFVEAGSRDAAISILSGHGLFVLSIAEAEKLRWYDRAAAYFGRIRRKDMVIFTRQLATLLEARFPLNEALKTIARQTSHRVLHEAVTQISQDIDTGLALSQALERQGNIFSNFFVSMVRSAEATGNLDEAAQFLADYYEKDSILRGKVISALIYPVVVIGLFIVVALVMVTVVFPQIGPIFEESGVELPFFARMLVTSARFTGTWWPAIVVAIIVIAILIMDYLQTQEGRAFWDDLKVRLPVFNRIYVPLSIARFANASSVLLNGGVPVSQTMEIVSHTVDNIFYQDLIHEAAEAVRRGEPLSRAMAKHPDYFPALVPQMLVIGESTGQLGKVFMRLANFYNREADAVIGGLVDIIQPMLMIGVGIMVALLFASILIPLYQLTSTIR